MINNTELLCVVDEFNIPITPQPRDTTHSMGYWHRTAHIWIINTQRELLCQKRSMKKDEFPGVWETFVGGHLGPDDDYQTGAIKELFEETGIIVAKEELQLVQIHKDERTKEYRGVFYLIWNGTLDQIISERDEVDEVKWIPLKTIVRTLTESHRKWSRPGYEDSMFPFLEEAFIDSELL